MYLRAYLQEAKDMGDRRYNFNVEYRLVCSGEFYNRSLGTESWRSFEAARLLLDRPFELFVVSRPFNWFPQELCLRFGVNWIRENQAGGDSTGHASPPYNDLVEDVCAVLTLLSRRLVVPAFEVRTLHRSAVGSTTLASFRDDAPSPIVAVGDSNHWGIRVSRAEWTGRSAKLVEHIPPALGVDRGALERAFGSFCQGEYASVLLQAARTYSSALQLILPRPELAYQLLISAVETLANRVFSDYQPSKEDMIKRKCNVAAKATSYGLPTEEVEALALEACKGEFWAGRKFRKFFTKFSSDEAWGPDPVFPIAEGWEPEREHLDRVLCAIYNARSKYLHEGTDFPPWISHGSTVAVPARFHELPEPAKYVPPVTWFEQLVSSAVRCMIANETPFDREKPFLEAPS